MALHFRPSSNLGTQAGQQAAGYLSQGINALLNQKAQEMQDRKLMAAYEQAGLPGSYAFIDPKIALAQLAQQQAGRESQQDQILNQALYGTEPHQGMTPQRLQQELAGLQQQQQQPQPTEETRELLPTYGKRIQDILGGKLKPGAQPLGIERTLESVPSAPATPPEEIPYLERLRRSGLPLTKKNVEEATKADERRQKEQGETLKRNAAAFKETKEERKQIVDKARAARQNIHDLERLEELEKEGKLDTPGYVAFLQNSGLDIPALLDPSSQEFQKVAQSFLRDAKTYLGARISNFELEQFLKTIPSLSQSPEGRKRVISNLKYFNRAALAYNDAYRDILKENKGVPPLDLTEKIEDKIEPKLNRIGKQLKDDFKKKVPKGEPGYKTALLSIAGSALGTLGNALASVPSAVARGLGYGLGGAAVRSVLGGGSSGLGPLEEVLDNLSGGGGTTASGRGQYVYLPRGLGDVTRFGR